MDLEVAPGVRIPQDACTFSAVRASGPGGQNVNKVATRVLLRVEVDRIVGLTPESKARLREIAGRRWVEGGYLQVVASMTRNQLENRQIAEAKVVELIRLALVPPKKRRATKPTWGSVIRRVEAKRERSQIKQSRRSRPDLD
ncbi:MAG: aminoacyl-tRNA hydrolase [Candidatus Sericytochromatia bacterium]|uniref:Aminoacyl-tRNA hydrolase n=1 Tax=Candidatus Tanganyikabacteria bacterium TaxID=2961651 RepID=A0A937X7C2_9BACT|nr:aminoacyl-tRNA hydrolase [Candidatus Tanganyikabacteria bacterium]